MTIRSTSCIAGGGNSRRFVASHVRNLTMSCTDCTELTAIATPCARTRVLTVVSGDDNRTLLTYRI